MKRLGGMLATGLLTMLAPLTPSTGQTLAIVNAHIIDGTGGTIDRGTVVVSDGKIASVGAADAPADATTVIDAAGRTVMPGFIDAHRHLGNSTSAEDMQAFLDAGFTTVVDALSNVDALAALRRRIEDGELAGPRLRISAMVPVNRAPMPQGVTDAGRADPARIPLTQRQPIPAVPPETARAMVTAAAEKGANNIKTVLIASPDGSDVATMKAIAEEAHKHGMRYLVHATSIDDTLVAIEGGADILAHTPHEGWVDEGGALQKIAASSLPMDTTLGVFTPYFGPEGEDIMRDFHPFPDDTLHSAGQGPVNARLLWKSGIKLAFGTDTVFSPSESLRHELNALVSLFAPGDIIAMMTANAARAAGVEKETGTLEPGKAADLAMLADDPLTDIYATLDVVLVLRDGKVVVDRRQEDQGD